MKFSRLWLLGLALAAVPLSQPGPVGRSLPAKLDLEGFTQTKATSMDDLVGRAVLIEFFAYW